MPEIFSQMTELAEFTLERAQAAGAQAAAVDVKRSRFVEAAFRDGELEKASASSKQGLSLTLFLDGRYAVHSTSDLGQGTLRKFVQEAAALTRTLAPDPDRGLADPARLARPPAPDLKVFDPALAEPAAETWLAKARRLEELAREAGGNSAAKLVSSQGAAQAEVSRELLATSNGFLGQLAETAAVEGCNLVFLDPAGDAKRRTGGWWEVERELAALGGEERMAAIAAKAAARAARLMGAKPGPSGRFPLVVENQAAGRLVSDLLRPLGGPALKQKKSCLAGKLGQAVAHPLLDIWDEPQLPGGFGSRWYDAEGVAAKKMAVIQAGVLKNYFLDTYHSKVLKLPPSTGSSSNLILTSSHKNGFEGLYQNLKKGLAVTSFLGGNFNPTTGDYSYGLSGLWIEDGRPVHAVDGMNMAGNLSELWNMLTAVGGDPFPYARARTPSLAFGEVQLAGA
ncbi:MAG: TldD/PmbA family protein [Deltaproteobacteria bacterium]|nr:TldD/PmbA family protein [Deltaproteobacteria bacterium]